MSDANNIQALAAGVGIHAPVTTPQPFYWSVRRELWENRSIYIAPLAVAGLILLSFFARAAHLPARVRAAAHQTTARPSAGDARPSSGQRNPARPGCTSSARALP